MITENAPIALQELAALIIEIRSLQSELLRAAIQDFIHGLASVDQRGVVADCLHGRIDAAVLELHEGVCEVVLRLEDGDAVSDACVPRIGIAEDDDGVADRPGIDVVSYLLEIGCAGHFIA